MGEAAGERRSVLGPDVTGEFLGIGFRGRQGEVDGVSHFGVDFSLDRLQFLGGGQVLVGEVAGQALDWIPLCPEILLGLGTQLIRVRQGVPPLSPVLVGKCQEMF